VEYNSGQIDDLEEEAMRLVLASKNILAQIRALRPMSPGREKVVKD
jgi:hypothetical protein